MNAQTALFVLYRDKQRKEFRVAQEIVEAPLTGKIISIEVGPGDQVSEGDTMVLLESMKMENPIVAPVNGTVVKVEVSPGQIVKAGQVIIVIEH